MSPTTVPLRPDEGERQKRGSVELSTGTYHHPLQVSFRISGKTVGGL